MYHGAKINKLWILVIMYRCMFRSSLFLINGRMCFTNPLCTKSLSRTREERNCSLRQCTYYSPARALKCQRHNLQPICTHQALLHRCMSSTVHGRRLPSAFPVVEGSYQLIHRHVFEVNLQNSQACHQRYLELKETALKAGGENGIARHTQRNKKMLVRERLHMLLDDDDYLELSLFAGLGLPYGDIPSASCLTGIGKINGLWCVFIANDATVKGGTSYPITVKKQLRAQEVAIQNRLPCVYLVDSGGAFLPLQADIFPDKNHGGRIFYNEAIMSAMKIPQVAVVCGSCTAGGAYVPTMAEESIIVHRIGTIFLGGPPLVKAATGEEVTAEDLGGARLHSELSGCIEHFAAVESEAYECTRNIISTLNFKLPEEDSTEIEEPLYNPEELMGLAPRSYNFSMDVKLIVSRLTDGSRFQEFKSRYGSTLLTGFAKIKGHLVGIVANNGRLTYEACLKGSHFVQLCDQRDIPLIFLQNTAPEPLHTLSRDKAESNTMVLKALSSMMSAVACASTPKITVVIGGCHGGDSYAMCGRAFDPNFLFLWPNARVSILAPGHADVLVQDEEEATRINEQLKEESSAIFSSGRVWDDGVILPQDTRKVLGQCLKIIKQQEYQLSRGSPKFIPLRM